jgi:hypothetical protein
MSKATWVGAVGSCTGAQRGCIVTINDQLEQDCIAANTGPGFPDAVWLGYHRNTGTDAFVWQCGESTFPPAWATGEPGVENCAAMTDAGAWVNVNCGGTASFVCELP